MNSKQTISEANRRLLGLAVNAYYDCQAIRKASMNRLRAIVMSKLEGRIYTDREIMNILREGMHSMFSDEEREYIVEQLDLYTLSRSIEQSRRKALIRLIRDEPIWSDFLEGVKGISAILCASLLKEFGYCETYRQISSLWKHCVPPDELILTDDGYKEIREIKVGDFILDGNGKPTRVLKTFKREYSGSILQIKAQGVLPFSVTPEHPLLVAKVEEVPYIRGKPRKQVKEMFFSPAREVKKGDYLVIPKLKLTDKSGEVKTPKLFGRFVADGSTTLYKEGKYDRGYTCIVFGNNEEWTSLKKEMELYGKPRVCKQESAYQVFFGRLKTSRLFRGLFGERAVSKKIPRCILFSDRETVREFIKGYLDGDGHFEPKSERFYASTVSKGLALQLQLLSTKLDTLPHLRFSKRRSNVGQIGGRKIRQKDRYIIGFSPKSSEIFSGRKSRWKYKRSKVLEDENYFYVPVVLVEKGHYSGYVYNLHTESNTFLLNNCVVHNCGLHVINGKAPKKEKGVRLDWNPRLRVLAWRIGDSMIKQRTPYYRDIYDLEKERQCYLMRTEAENAPKNKLHADLRARRKMVKIFLAHYWYVCRKIKRLETRPPYVQEKLGHKHIVMPVFNEETGMWELPSSYSG